MHADARELFHEFDVRINGEGLRCTYPCLGMMLGIFFREATLYGRGIAVPHGRGIDYRTFDYVRIVVNEFQSGDTGVDVNMVRADCTFLKERREIDRTVVYAAYDSSSHRVMPDAGANLDLIINAASRWDSSVGWYLPEGDSEVS